MAASSSIINILFKGGFSHVYLVRTPTPVYNTTHHVLKRIGVPNEAMLAEVKKEVDIMVRSTQAAYSVLTESACRGY